MKNINITFLGTRGSIPVEGTRYAQYGGATSCVIVHIDNGCILFDAGSGIMSLPFETDEHEKDISILISHPHVDHICGIPICPTMFDKNKNITIYAAQHNGVGAFEQVNALMSPPLWPVTAEILGEQVNYVDITENFQIGNVEISTLEGTHPGGVTVYKLTYFDKTIVYATDFELTEENLPKLADFSKNCDLLICDGQYSDNEYESKKGFGHSSFSMVAKLGRVSNTKNLAVFHHDPYRTDAQLDDACIQAREIFDNLFFAKRGDRITL